MSDTKEIWLQAGHRLFARSGPDALKIDRLAKKVGKSRSVFYHHFGDLEEYQADLLEYHVDLAYVLNEESASINRFVPDYLKWLVSHKDHVLFSKQLFMNRQINPEYRKTWEQVSEISEDKTSELWMKMLGLENAPKYQTDQFYDLIRSAAFSRLDYDSLTYERLLEIVEETNRSFRFLLENGE